MWRRACAGSAKKLKKWLDNNYTLAEMAVATDEELHLRLQPMVDGNRLYIVLNELQRRISNSSPSWDYPIYRSLLSDRDRQVGLIVKYHKAYLISWHATTYMGLILRLRLPKEIVKYKIFFEFLLDTKNIL